MAVTFQHKIILRLGSMFCFETISSIADKERTLHRIADPPERKSSSKISEKIGVKQEEAQPPALRGKTIFSKLGARGPSTRRTPLSTSPTEKWTRITRKKEANEAKDRQAALSVPPSSKEGRKRIVATTIPFYPDILFIGGRVESNPISDDEPTAPGEEPLQRESRRWRNRRRNIRRHHEAGERDPAQPVSRDEVSEVGETLEERVLRERRNSRRRDHRQPQEQAEQETRQRRENPLFGRNLNPDFAQAMNTPSEVGGVLAWIADGLPRALDAEGYRRLFTRAANHLLPLAHPPSDLRHAINSQRDARSSINASRERRHENKIRRRKEYDQDHDIPAQIQATRTESATASTGGTTRGRSRHHDNHSPPQDKHHHRRQEDTCGV
jgi:O-methyltransferase involved in polyketide biosynthesis